MKKKYSASVFKKTNKNKTKKNPNNTYAGTFSNTHSLTVHKVVLSI